MYPDPDINPEILVAVAKVVIAIAWADGEIQDEEKECIKAMLSNVPDLSDDHLEILEDFLSEPVERTEREIIIEELGRLITNQRERNFAVYWLHDIVNAKGKQDEREMKIFNAVNSRFVKQVHATRTPWKTEEVELRKEGVFDVDAFIKLYAKEIKQVASFARITVPQYKHIVLVGSLIALITRADNRISESEVDVMKDYIMSICQIKELTAHDIVKIILTMEVVDGAALPYICESLLECTEAKERSGIMQVLFDVSMGEGPLDFDELNRIIHISALLKIPQAEFQIALKKYDAAVAAES